jgi:hypothetical protein
MPKPTPRIAARLLAALPAVALATLAAAPARADETPMAPSAQPAPSAAVPAEPLRAPEPTHWSAEADVLGVVSMVAGNGYSLHLNVKPAATPHLRFGLSVYQFELPTFAISSENAGWSFGSTSVAADVHVYLAENRRGWFAGAYLGYERPKFGRDGATVQTNRFEAIPHVGYQWFPVTGSGFFVTPWIGARINVVEAGTPTLGDRTYHDPRVQPFGTIHVGFEL